MLEELEIWTRLISSLVSQFTRQGDERAAVPQTADFAFVLLGELEKVANVDPNETAVVFRLEELKVAARRFDELDLAFSKELFNGISNKLDADYCVVERGQPCFFFNI